ncbi:uncharacterized protein BDW70DRAFT_140892 [Aspergillus foveolatus]|uniref:uncharacterized protein n=1 Tax=Aspergillus foveolatus TaxID=210207 RepID=UPI003CCD4F06
MEQKSIAWLLSFALFTRAWSLGRRLCPVPFCHQHWRAVKRGALKAGSTKPGHTRAPPESLFVTDRGLSYPWIH